MVLLKKFALALGLASQAWAKKSLRSLQVERDLERLQQEFTSPTKKLAATPKVYALNVSLPVDHFGKLPGTNFTNRYWVVDAYYEPGGPVFAFDTGESNGGDGYIGYATSNTFFNKYLQEFKGLAIIWEHRYYGQSVPFPINLNTTSEQLQYLTTENALADFDVFARQFQWSGFPNSDFSPSVTPWVVVGGSYPGMRAAMLRHFYPDTVFASYAASPPLEARVDMSAYFEQVYRGMNQYGLGNCTRNIKRAVDYIDSQLDHPDTAAAIKVAFLGRTAEQNSNSVFSDILQFPFFDWQGSGIDEVMLSFCDALEFGDDGTQANTTNGKVLADRWANWPFGIEIVQSLEEGSGYCEGPQPQNTTTPNCQLDTRFTDQLSISWTWQYCSQWGFFQFTNAGPHALGSRYNDLAHQQEICYRQYPDGLSSGLLPTAPKTAEINALTGGWAIRPSNVFFTEGQFDPWRTLSPLSNESFSEHYPLTQDIPECGVSTNETVFGYLLPNSQHCYDFDNISAAAPPTELFRQALTSWLKCF